MNIKSLINNLPMKKKLLLSFSIVVFIPIIISIYFKTTLQSAVVDNAKAEVINSVDRVSLRMNQLLDSISSSSFNIAYDPTLTKTLTAHYETDYDMVKALRNVDVINTYIQYDKNIAYLNYYIASQRVLNTGYIKNPSTDIVDTDWYKKSKTSKIASWALIHNPSFTERKSSSEDLTLLRPSYARGSFLGVLTVAVSKNAVVEILNQETSETWLVTPDFIIFAANNPEVDGKSIKDLGLEFIDGKFKKTEAFSNQTTTIISQDFHVMNTNGYFYIVSQLPTDAIIKSTVHEIKISNLIVIIGSLLSVIMLILFSDLLTHRLSKLGKDIKRATEGDLEFIPIVDANDEIGTLSLYLGNMLANIKALINEVYIAQMQKEQLQNKQQEIQLQILNSQINPHFLFNALESIRMKAVSDNEPDIASAIRMLSNLLRKSLKASNEPILLQEEIDLANDYLDLQKFRYHDLDYKINILCDITDQYAPCFTLQPIVENAVRHGFGNIIRSSSYVSITITKEENNIIIRVADNGSGIDEETLVGLQERLNSTDMETPNTHIGIINVHQRLRLLYGNVYGITLSSQKNKGTIITIRIPCH